MAVDDLGQIGLRIDAAEFVGLDERGDDRPVFSATVGISEEGVLAIEGDWADGTLDGVGVDLDAAIFNEAGESLLA
jgi:hypothetical protein